MNHRASMIAAMLGGILAVADHNTPECPDCKRLKARSADDCSAGKCPKWYAVRDPEAKEDCQKFATDPEYRKLCEYYQHKKNVEGRDS